MVGPLHNLLPHARPVLIHITDGEEMASVTSTTMSLIAANKRDYLPDACFYRGTDESSRLYPGSKRQSDKRASCTIYNNGAHWLAASSSEPAAGYIFCLILPFLFVSGATSGDPDLAV